MDEGADVQANNEQDDVAIINMEKQLKEMREKLEETKKAQQKECAVQKKHEEETKREEEEHREMKASQGDT